MKKKLVAGFEGGAIYTAEKYGTFLVIIDEGTLIGMLHEDDKCEPAVKTY